MKGRRDVSRLKFWWKLVNLENDKLKQVYLVCKPILENERASWFYGIRKLLNELNLAHVWGTEATGARGDWLALVKGCFKQEKRTDGGRACRKNPS